MINKSLLVPIVFAIFGSFSNCDVTVQTKYGIIQGIETSKSRAFLGVPFASPPVGPLRWRPPLEPNHWYGTLDTKEVKPGCYQVNCSSMNPTMVCPKSVSEDCLYLNIWTPLNITGPVPVMVFLHGGNFVHLSGSSILFNGEDFVSKGNVILVNADYRLGAFGFLVTGTGANDARGNYGIMDQRQALIWVHENIIQFGGDPQKVTLFGQSAGAQSTAVHLANGKANGLFQQAIIESAPFDIRYKTKEEALFLGDVIAELCNCSGGDIECLRRKPAEVIGIAQHKARSVVTSPFLLEFFEPVGPWIDGDEVKMEPVESAHRGQFQDIPIMIGTVSEETRIYVYEAWQKKMSLKTFFAVLLLTNPLKVIETVRKYPPTNISDCRDTLVEIATDFIFTCTARNVTRSLQKLGHTAEMYTYIYNHAFSFQGWENFSYCEGHVCHGSELPFLFHTPHLAGFNMTSEEEKLSSELIHYWTNFAYTSNPNEGPHAVDINWPAYHSNQIQEWYMHFQTPNNEVLNQYRKDFCQFWDSVGYFV